MNCTKCDDSGLWARDQFIPRLGYEVPVATPCPDCDAGRRRAALDAANEQHQHERQQASYAKDKKKKSRKEETRKKDWVARKRSDSRLKRIYREMPLIADEH
jgi:hypothetical protein